MKQYQISMLATYLNKARAIAEQYPELSDVWDKIEDALTALNDIDVEENTQ